MKPLPLGTRIVHRVVPTRQETPAAAGLDGVEVVGTPSVVMYAEDSCHRCIAPFYEPGEVSVGARVEIDHLAPSLPGEPLDCEAEVTAVEGRKVSFRYEIRQGEKVVARGTHRRAVVPLSRFAAPQKKEQGEVTFWFDFHSPWCYLGSVRVERFAARHGRRVRWRPLHLVNLMQAINGRKSEGQNPAWLAWYRQDLQDWAAQCGVKVAYHPNYPLRPARALRMALYAADQGAAAPFVKSVMRAYWQESRDISELDVLGALAAEAGLPVDEAIAAANDPARKEELDRNTKEAIEAGVFGVPAFIAEGKLFFGNDRLELMDGWLTGR